MDAPTPTILVVEDEPLLRMTATDMINEAGWNAVEAQNSVEALSALRDHPEIAVLFTDIRMPGPMDGLELAACVHKLRPDIHLVVTSGHVVIADAVLPAGGTFVGKPYRLDQLIQVIGSKIHQLD